MTRKRRNKRNGTTRSNRKANYKLEGEIADELEVYALASGLDKKELVENGLVLLFKERPLSKKLREAAETILGGRHRT